MPEVTAIHSFKHAGKSRAKGAEWSASAEEAESLRRAGLVRIKPSATAKAATKKPVVKPAAKKAAAPKPGQLTA